MRALTLRSATCRGPQLVSGKADWNAGRRLSGPAESQRDSCNLYKLQIFILHYKHAYEGHYAQITFLSYILEVPGSSI